MELRQIINALQGTNAGMAFTEAHDPENWLRPKSHPFFNKMTGDI